MIFFKRMLNKTDLGLSGKNGAEILLSPDFYKYFTESMLFKDVVDPSNDLLLNLKQEASRKLTGKKLVKYFNEKGTEEGDFVYLFLFESGDNFIDIIKSDCLIFKKYKKFGYQSLSETKMEKYLKKLPYISKYDIDGEMIDITIDNGVELKLRKDSIKATQLYTIHNVEKDFFCLDVNNKKVVDVGKDSLVLIEENSISNIFSYLLDSKQELKNVKDSNQKCKIKMNELGNKSFKKRNILFKGVPGTGKSKLVNDIIRYKLDLVENHKNILRINIHSASSNADLMQGIGITTTDNNQVAYHEKQGLIFKHIQDAICTPNQPFVLVLEEIQENSLNELIGDLIYLIEDDKRTIIDTTNLDENKEYEYQELIEAIAPEHYVKIPFLVNTSTEYRKMILPKNLYIFCTSNYRDDKKVIEDNLLRRFDVIEVYPEYKDNIGKDFLLEDVSEFLKALNKVILEIFSKNGEIHPDRFLIGHANWLKVTSEQEFYRALLKVVVDFKEIKEIDFDSGIKAVFQKMDLTHVKADWLKKAFENVKIEQDYKSLVDKLQKKAYADLFTSNKLSNK